MGNFVRYLYFNAGKIILDFEGGLRCTSILGPSQVPVVLAAEISYFTSRTRVLFMRRVVEALIADRQ